MALLQVRVQHARRDDEACAGDGAGDQGLCRVRRPRLNTRSSSARASMTSAADPARHQLSRREMRAARFHGQSDIRIEDVAVPELHAIDDVLVEVLWCGICGT